MAVTHLTRLHQKPMTFGRHVKSTDFGGEQVVLRGRKDLDDTVHTAGRRSVYSKYDFGVAMCDAIFKPIPSHCLRWTAWGAGWKKV